MVGLIGGLIGGLMVGSEADMKGGSHLSLWKNLCF
jgi:hypothetical protein